MNISILLLLCVGALMGLAQTPLHPYPPVGGTYIRTACDCTTPSQCMSPLPSSTAIGQNDFDDPAILIAAGPWDAVLGDDGSFVATSTVSPFTDCAGQFDTPDSFSFSMGCTGASDQCNMTFACIDNDGVQDCLCQFESAFTRVPLGPPMLVGFCNQVPNGTFIGPVAGTGEPMFGLADPDEGIYRVYILREEEERNFLNSMPFQCENPDCMTARNRTSFNNIVRTSAFPRSNYSVYVECIEADCDFTYGLDLVEPGRERESERDGNVNGCRLLQHLS